MALSPFFLTALFKLTVLMHLNRHQNTETRKQRHGGGAAIADQGQRHPHHRQNTYDHAHIDEDIDKERQRQSAREIAAIAILGLHHNVKTPGKDDGVGRQKPQAPNKPKLFSKNRKNEIRRTFWEKFEMNLGAMQPALAAEATRPNRDL